MESKVVIKKFLDASDEESCAYIHAALDDWSDAAGPGIDGSLAIHDGKNLVRFWLTASDDEDYERSIRIMRELAAAIEVTEREFTMAYLDAKIRSSNAEAEASTPDAPDSVQKTEEDWEVQVIT